MPDRQEKKDDRSPLERVTGENDVSPEEERQRNAASSDEKGRLQDMAEKVKDAAREALGTGKREPTEASQEAQEMLRERRDGSDRRLSSDGPGNG
ncbi:hypothetical protein [Streptomyces virginiae]|uniref:hypothetical protein n=1 Tax=Streptomyces virginiae TaxID=1961 RepID=UPI00343DF649